MNSGIVKVIISVSYLCLLMAYVSVAQDPTPTTSATTGTTPTPKTEPSTTTGVNKGAETKESPSPKASTPSTPTTTAKGDSTLTTAKTVVTTKSGGVRSTGVGAAFAVLVCVAFAAL